MAQGFPDVLVSVASRNKCAGEFEAGRGFCMNVGPLLYVLLLKFGLRKPFFGVSRTEIP